MPLDNIERAIKRGAGGSEGASIIETIYEGYGPGGAAILLEAMTDNRNRTIAEVRNVFSRSGGSLGESGCVTWLFQPKGVITVEAADAEEMALRLIDAGAEDIKIIDGSLEVHIKPEDLESVRKTLEGMNLAIVSAEIVKVPKTTVMLEEKAALQTLKLLDRLEELDEVQHVFTNADFPDEALEKYRRQG